MGLFINPTTAAPEQAITASASVVNPLLKNAKAAPYGARRTITASAQQLPTDKVVQNQAYHAWQADAWTGYEKIGEIHYGFNQTANVMSRVRVFAAAVADNDEAPMEAKAAAERNGLSRELALHASEAMADLTSTDFSAMLRTFTICVSVTGEVYLVHLPEPEPKSKDGKPAVDIHTGKLVEAKKTWTFRSTDEISIKPNMVELIPIRSGGTDGRRKLPNDTFIGRIWKSSGRYSGEPDSSMVAIAEPIEELLVLGRLVRSTTKSRLNAGMLFIPEDVTTANRTPEPEALDVEGNPLPVVDDDGSQLIEDLIDSMVTPISDEGSAASVVPLLVTGPRDSGEKIKHLTFERKQSDEWLVSRMERTLERVLQGLDFPKELVSGLANVKYSNALIIDENYYRANIEPLCLMLVDALTEVYLKPVLRARGVSEEDLKRVCVWYDPSEIITRPSAAQDASDGYDKMLLSGDAWRREHGYGENDKPSEEELAFMLLVKSGTMPDEITTALYNVVLPNILGKQRDAAIAEGPVPMPESAANILQLNRKATQVSDAVSGG